MNELFGLIISARGGFYDVQTEDGTLYQCRAKGGFRREGLSPLCGDNVRFLLSPEGGGYLVEILERKSQLLRPLVANISTLLLILSVVEPPPNLPVVDRLIAVAEHKGIEPVIVLTKTDLAPPAEVERFTAIYRGAGFSVYPLSSVTGQGVPPLGARLGKGIHCLCGNTGAGKSSLLNAIDPNLSLETGEISKKLGRGRHTTRHVELYPLSGGGYIVDTPGFSAVEFSRYQQIKKEELQHCYREFAPFLGGCKYVDCSHTKEVGCAVLEALAAGKIAQSRHQSYWELYEEAKKQKEWERKDNGH